MATLITDNVEKHKFHPDFKIASYSENEKKESSIRDIHRRHKETADFIDNQYKFILNCLEMMIDFDIDIDIQIYLNDPFQNIYKSRKSDFLLAG